MKWVDATFAFRSEHIHTISNPASTITGDNFDAGKLFRCKLPVEFLKNSFAMTLMCPNNGIGIVV